MADRKTQKLLDGLQQDLERELKVVLLYSLQSCVLLGPRAMNIAPMLRKDAEAELKHVAFIGDQIVNLGGVPKFSTQKIGEPKDLKTMLEGDLDLEREAILEYRERAKQAELAGEIGLKVRIEEILAEETDHMRALERILRAWQ